MAKNVAFGINDFKMIVEGNYAFADKTLMIKEFFQFGAHVTLVPRPRRFGKTMNLSMLRYFCEKTEQSHAYLFDGLKVSQHPETMAHQGQYPVIFLTFKDIKVPAWEACYDHLQGVIGEEYRRHNYLLHSTNLDKSQKEIFQAIIDKKASQVDYELSLKNLSMYLHTYHNKRVIILIDEYDTPIQEAAAKDFDKKSEEKAYYSKAIYFIRNLLCACLKDNPILQKGFLTGILRVSKESIFSGMNNVAVCSLTATGAAKNIAEGKIDNVLFTDKFGLLEEEVADLFEQTEAPLDLDLIRQWYNGYSSGPFRVYNPWSIAGYLTYRKLQAYWINTSDNKLIKDLTRQSSAQTKDDLAMLIEGGRVDKIISEEIVFSDLRGSDKALWSFLLFCGYITFFIGEEEEPGDMHLQLALPNQEVKAFFKDMIQGWFATEYDKDPVTPMLTNLVFGNIDTFKERFQKFAINCFSYLDVTKEDPERFYHAFMLGIIVGLEKTYFITSNREAGTGRYDLMLEPRDPKGIGFIVELKKFSKRLDKNLEDTARRAMAQIEEKQYEAALRARGITNIVKLAIVFNGKESLIQESGE